MSYTITREDILSVSADAVVLCIENRMIVTDTGICRKTAEAGGAQLQAALRARKFLPVGSAEAVGVSAGGFRQVILCAAPRWENTRGNEILILHRCYENIFRIAQELGCESVATPFLSTFYYGFPKDDAVHVALTEAEKTDLKVCFVTDSEEVYALGQKAFVKPAIVSYIGYYRDHAIFELENGRFARVDIRPEIREVTLVPFFEPCFRVGNNPLQPAMPESEIRRLMQVYQETDW